MAIVTVVAVNNANLYVPQNKTKATVSKQAQQNFIESFSAVGVLKIALIPPIQVPSQFTNFTTISYPYSFGKPSVNSSDHGYIEFEQLAVSISKFVNLKVTSKTRDDPGHPNTDI